MRIPYHQPLEKGICKTANHPAFCWLYHVVPYIPYIPIYGRFFQWFTIALLCICGLNLGSPKEERDTVGIQPTTKTVMDDDWFEIKPIDGHIGNSFWH